MQIISNTCGAVLFLLAIILSLTCIKLTSQQIHIWEASIPLECYEWSVAPALLIYTRGHAAIFVVNAVSQQSAWALPIHPSIN